LNSIKEPLTPKEVLVVFFSRFLLKIYHQFPPKFFPDIHFTFPKSLKHQPSAETQQNLQSVGSVFTVSLAGLCSEESNKLRETKILLEEKKWSSNSPKCVQLECLSLYLEQQVNEPHPEPVEHNLQLHTLRT
jgi:hypothetical protein